MPNCVLTVPPCFSQRQRFLGVARHGGTRGFPCVKLLDDTLAALLMAGDALRSTRKSWFTPGGASAFCVALYQVKGSTLRAISLDGSRDLGADEVDAAIAEAILCQLAKNSPGEIPTTDPQFLHRVAEVAALIREAMAAGEEGSVDLPRVWGSSPPHHLASPPVRISPRVFTDSMARMTAETLKLVEKVLTASQTSAPGAILSVGRMAALPDVERSLRNRFRLRCSVRQKKPWPSGRPCMVSIFPKMNGKARPHRAPCRKQAFVRARITASLHPSRGRGAAAPRRPATGTAMVRQFRSLPGLSTGAIRSGASGRGHQIIR